MGSHIRHHGRIGGCRLFRFSPNPRDSQIYVSIMNQDTVRAVKCGVCGQLHEVDADTFVSVAGNICIGEGGGLIGDNLDQGDRVVNVSIFCRGRCFGKAIEKALECGSNGLEFKFPKEVSPFHDPLGTRL